MAAALSLLGGEDVKDVESEHEDALGERVANGPAMRLIRLPQRLGREEGKRTVAVKSNVNWAA
jgi:hypothetical protein